MKPNSRKNTIHLTEEHFPIVMVRFSEIGIKSSKTRKWLTKRLISHIDFILKENNLENFNIENRFSRILVSSNEPKKVEYLLSKNVPGIASLSRSFECSTDFDSITELIKSKFYSKIRNSSSFAIKVKRTGKHGIISIMLEEPPLHS